MYNLSLHFAPCSPWSHMSETIRTCDWFWECRRIPNIQIQYELWMHLPRGIRDDVHPAWVRARHGVLKAFVRMKQTFTLFQIFFFVIYSHIEEFPAVDSQCAEELAWIINKTITKFKPNFPFIYTYINKLYFPIIAIHGGNAMSPNTLHEKMHHALYWVMFGALCSSCSCFPDHAVHP